MTAVSANIARMLSRNNRLYMWESEVDFKRVLLFCQVYFLAANIKADIWLLIPISIIILINQRFALWLVVWKFVLWWWSVMSKPNYQLADVSLLRLECCFYQSGVFISTQLLTINYGVPMYTYYNFTLYVMCLNDDWLAFRIFWRKLLKHISFLTVMVVITS